jgi:hypothetical protein
MKKLVITLSLLFLAFMLSGCPSSDYNLDGEVVKTADGRLFVVKHNIGDNYYFREVNVHQVEQYLKLKED